MDKLRVGIIGCGQIADGHVSEIQKLDNASVVAVCDTEIIIAEQLATRFEVNSYYNSHLTMLERETLDVVHICTPPGTHLFLTKDAIDAGCHVYVEKPLALTYAESVALIEYVENAGKKITIGHNSEFESPTLELRDLVAKGELGDPVHVESWYGYNLSGSFGKAIMSSPAHWVHRLPGKLFQNNINHMLNKVTEFMDDMEPEVHAISWRQDQSVRFGDVRDDLHDELRVVLRGRDITAYGTFSSAVRPVGHYAKVYGTKGIVDLDYVSRSVTIDNGVKYPSALGRLASCYSQAWRKAKSAFRNTKRFYNYEYHFFDGMGTLIDKFYNSILYDLPVPISTDKMLRIAWIMDQIFTQIERQKKS